MIAFLKNYVVKSTQLAIKVKINITLRTQSQAKCLIAWHSR